MFIISDKIEQLVLKYKYKSLPNELSQVMRSLYRDNIPEGLKIEGDSTVKLISPVHNTDISLGYSRIVIGDYGAYIEMEEPQIYRGNLKIAIGQEYRVNDEKYVDKVKYVWLSTKLNECKIYLQKRTVPYADYIPGKYYISVFDILVEK